MSPRYGLFGLAVIDGPLHRLGAYGDESFLDMVFDFDGFSRPITVSGGA
jgi:hypothetical protein